jgi:hypothetical protein
VIGLSLLSATGTTTTNSIGSSSEDSSSVSISAGLICGDFGFSVLTTELEDPTDNAVAVSESDGDAYSQEAHDEIDANETDSDVTCRSASTEKSNRLGKFISS